MKDNTSRKLQAAGIFLGAFAYGFTHAPIALSRGIRDHFGKKKKETKKATYEVYAVDIRDLPKESPLIQGMLEYGIITEEELN